MVIDMKVIGIMIKDMVRANSYKTVLVTYTKDNG